MMLNITTFLDANACRLAKPVFYCPERNTSYTSSEVLGISSEIARTLKSFGVAKGDRVLLYLNSSPEYLFSYLAVWRVGAVAVPTNRVYTATELSYMIKDAGANVFITDPEGTAIAKDLGVIVFVPENIEFYRTAPILLPEPTESDDLCQLQYTSGTTGKPKGAMLTHGNWLTAVHNECDVLTLKQDDVYLGIYPMGHVGLSWGVAAMRAGALYIMMERYDPDTYLSLCKIHHVTVLSGMPPVIHFLEGAPAGTEEMLATTREIISGGGPLHHETWKNFHYRYNIPVINAYGLSETVVIGTGTVIRPEDYASADRFQSVGHPVCFSEVKIVDEADASKVMPPETPGEIALRGPAVAKGYWGLPEETARAFLPDGWFLTGDIGYLDKDQRLCLTDRKKDMIVMSGWKIYPTEVEETLLQYQEVAEIAVFGIPHPHRGEVPAAAVVWRAGRDGSGNEAGLLAFAKEHLAGYKVPRKIYTVDALPRVNGWKLLRRELREKFS
ncbi:class I adenylate-forming enzyme family protein [Methanorbis rubei]|uniref:Long-chain-fatty-acid--CoA ligase n=1 Tax=Methanorbis rubei TaxID=3028300 RepID=A0AAE4MEV1_9EURY|nr:Long-chain-fatty-acid--CoA ligase [Methanocorpusculaceae archaeon Cs1]